ncbi:secreted seminal-vesicle Ly-6 protein 1-like [Nannospalax galili]|uniref:secreted seminal-vesicle Ly-6 protein 1-like n=1 Tax=Nannospalax galili TaxID=1026970 RepID=UPI000819E80D|nr:secreted seminal-vesicle Ly-6 protein 1-like [Nannospalax galili]XP_017654025.1 secreted seminal-vesicle Ly-6 protein 1-like [Nannospalax galili]
MGKHFLLLLLGLSLLVGFLQALTCLQCDFFNSEGICEKEERSCEIKSGHQCITMIISKDNQMLYGVQDCTNTCVNSTNTVNSVTVEVICCSDQSFCNRL